MILGFVVCSQMKGCAQDEEKSSEETNVYVEVPDGDVTDLPPSKSDIYMTSPASSYIQDYWNDCEDEYASMKEESPETSSGGNGSGGQVTSKDLFGEGSASNVKPSGGGSGGGSSSNPYRERAQEREARHQKRREEAIELADRMSGKEDAAQKTDRQEVLPVTIPLPESEVRRSDVISSLDDPWADSGISSLDDGWESVAPDDEHPFKCMFVREEKIKSGQRVSVRLLEDIVVGGILIPKNSHLMASCTINRRLEMEIANIEMQGRILSLGYEAFDTDGTKGIYCPDTGNAGKTVKNKGASLAGTALSSRVGRLASDVVTTGVSLIESASGERTVSVPAGYTFFIVKKKTTINKSEL